MVLAWTREGRHDLLAGREDVTLLARRLVAQRCLYGVDKNAYAVNLAKLSLWLVTLAKDLPFTFVDHALRHGDSLVGLSFEQIMGFHWKPGAQLELCKSELEATLGEAIKARLRILELAADPSPAAQKEKEWLLRDAEDALDRVRLLGDLVVGAFFAADKDKERERERDRRLDLVLEWLRAGGPPPDELLEMRRELRKRIPAFHWMAEYPEVFWVDRADPLDGDRMGEDAWLDAFVGNPPFAGKNSIAEIGGPTLLHWLKVLHAGAHGNADYSAHFFRRANTLLGEHGTIGLIATNTIAQGDTRASGLQVLVKQGLVIFEATRSMPWPGDAGVTVAVVHMAKGRIAAKCDVTSMLDGSPVAAINSRLRGGAERPDPVTLTANSNLSFQGSIILGMGFVLTPDERAVLVAKNRKNAERIFPYLGGDEVNTSPTQDFDRYVINFGELTLQEAARWPDLLEIVQEKVKPERDGSSHATSNWWHFERPRTDLYAALTGLKRCLITKRVQHDLTLSFQPIDRVFANTLYAFPLEHETHFSLLQSRVHSAWAWLLSSTMRSDLNYSSTDCFENFPFPQLDPRTQIAALDDVGRRLYAARAAYMVQTQQGLTDTYNRLKDFDCNDPEILQLRGLHLEMDRAVLTAYGWADLIDTPGVPPFTAPQTQAEKQGLAAFEDAVIDRLFELNIERASAEALAGSGSVPSGKNGIKNSGRRPTKKASKSKGREKPSEPSKQGSLFSVDKDDD